MSPRGSKRVTTPGSALGPIALVLISRSPLSVLLLLYGFQRRSPCRTRHQELLHISGEQIIPSSRRRRPLTSDESEQLRVDLILVRRGDAVRRAWVIDVLRVLDELGRLHSRVFHRNDLVVLAVKHQCRNIELL